MLILGIDPDAESHGAAFFADGNLTRLEKLTIVELMNIAREANLGAYGDEVRFSIENVCANNFVYARNVHASKNAQSQIAMRIGRCQQSQVELMRILDHFGIKYSLHKPTAKNWAKNKELFEKVTGWIGRSNEDTRSAAYFGWLEATGKTTGQRIT
jgi:hypothetical protein